MLMAENHRSGMQREPVRGRRWIVDGLGCVCVAGSWSYAGGKPQSRSGALHTIGAARIFPICVLRVKAVELGMMSRSGMRTRVAAMIGEAACTTNPAHPQTAAASRGYRATTWLR